MERLLDAIADDLALDRAEIRRLARPGKCNALSNADAGKID